MTEQPVWKCVGHIGDADPIAFGGGFVYQDETGVYSPELTWFEPAPDDQWHKTEGATPVEVYRIVLEPARFKTFAHGNWDQDRLKVPAQRGVAWVWHREWFMDDLKGVAESSGIPWIALARGLMSKRPMDRAHAYWDLIHYHGPHQFDHNTPLTMTEDEAYQRYAEEMNLARK